MNCHWAKSVKYNRAMAVQDPQSRKGLKETQDSCCSRAIHAVKGPKNKESQETEFGSGFAEKTQKMAITWSIKNGRMNQNFMTKSLGVKQQVHSKQMPRGTPAKPCGNQWEILTP